MSCIDGGRELLTEGEFMDATYCWLTGGADPTLTIVLPTVIYGAVLAGMYVNAESPAIPTVISIVLAGVIFSAFPAHALTIISIAILFGLAIGGLTLTWRAGR